MNSKSVAFLSLTLCAFGAVTARAAVTFTFSGTITADGGNAFELGETFTLSFTSNTDIGAPNLLNDATGVYWHESDAGHTLTWTEVTLSGATGTYAPPPSNDASNDLRSDSTRALYVTANTSSFTTDLGIIRGGEEFSFFEAWVDPVGDFTSYGGTAAVRPENTFINGTYFVTTPVAAYFYTDHYSNEYQATFSSLTISGAAVPEPDTYAAVLGLASLGWVMMRRRR